MAKTVTITISKGGSAKIDLAGFKGKGCDAVRKAFEEMGSVTASGHKPEYNGPSSGTHVSTGTR